jgi:hypothetical protein
MLHLPVRPASTLTKKRPRHCVINLSPDLFDALTELAKCEEIPLGALVVLLINSGLSERLARMPRWG